MSGKIKPIPVAPRPLDGVRVVDMSTVLMGPLATQIFGDYGADVVKVEPPEGDVARHAGTCKVPAMGSMYLATGRNKRSIVLDVKDPQGKQALLDLCRGADVFIHNVRPEGMRRAGLDYEDLRAINPQLIYVALVGFGSGGCYANRPAFDDIIQGATGLAGLFFEQGLDQPIFVPWNAADRLTGSTAVHATLAALLLRARTGEGQFIEVPMFETVAQMVLGDHLGGLAYEPQEGPAGYARLLSPGRKPYRTADGFIVVTPYNDKQFSALFELLEIPETTRRLPIFASLEVRQKNWPAIYELLSGAFLGKSAKEWAKLLSQAAIPAAVVSTITDLVADPHLEQVELFELSDHPTVGRIRQMRPSTSWSNADVSIWRHAPSIGEHSVEILLELGYAAEKIDAMLEAGITKTPDADLLSRD